MSERPRDDLAALRDAVLTADAGGATVEAPDTPDFNAPFEELRKRILLAALPNVPFDGWSQQALISGARGAGLDPVDVRRAFPGGPTEAVMFYSRLADQEMVAALKELPLETMRLRDRIAAAVRIRLEYVDRDREAVRRGLALLSLPNNAPLAARALYRTVDAIWWACGDVSTDFSFYTKRASLAGVYGSTTLYWLQDTSPGYAASWAFLDRRIEDVMRIPKLRQQMRRLNPLSGLMTGLPPRLPHLSDVLRPRDSRRRRVRRGIF